jgi:MFS transporter, CP family, cyanate transporter
VGTLGVLFVPLPPVVGPWAWVILGAAGVGGGFALGLSVIAWRSPDAARTGATSGLALGFGYLTAGVAPLVMGMLLDLTGAYAAPLTVLVLAGLSQAAATWLIGDGPHRRRRAP